MTQLGRGSKRGSLWLLVLLAFGTLASCASPLDPVKLRRHVLACDSHGDDFDPGTGVPIDYTEAYVDHILCSAEEALGKREGSKRILLHVHGGMNNAQSSLGLAQRSIDQILRAGDDDWHYPIFVTWDSGPFKAYGEYLLRLRHGRHANVWGPITAPVYFATDVLTGLINVPRVWIFQGGVDAAVGAKVAFDWNLLPSWQNSEKVYDALSAPQRDPSHVRVDLGSYRRGPLAQGWRFVRYVGMLPIKLFTSALIGPILGQGSWQGQKHSAANMFQSYDEFDIRTLPDAHSVIRSHTKSLPTGAFAEFFEQFSTFVKKQRERYPELEVTIVCHSMGAILINEALRLTRTPDAHCDCRNYELEIEHLVYMAPACTLEDAANSVVPYMVRHEDTRFYVLTLHPIAEGEEINVLDVPPRGSLLEWIDTYYTRAARPQERVMGKWINLMQSLHLFRSIASRTSIRGFGVDGEDSVPQKHGDFNRAEFWRKSFWFEEPGS